MKFKRIVPTLLILLLLAGCYRQAGDAFETVDGQSGQPSQPIIEEPTSDVVIIDPSEDDDAPDISGLELTATAIFESVNTDTTILSPDATATNVPAVQASPTVVIIQLDSPTNTPIGGTLPLPPQDAPGLLPTSTLPTTFITPESVEQLPTEIPVTPTAMPDTVDTGFGLVTPTALANQLPSECIYVIRGGDNLFRIALNNNVTLADLLAVNNLQENSVIQPGQELRLPNCVPQATAPDTGAPVTAPTALPTGTVLHTVTSGETLLVIARRYGVTVADIVGANSLPDPNRLSLGQELVIPNQ